MLWTNPIQRPILLVALMGVAALGACNRPTGGGQLSERYGEAYQLNMARQVAYKTPEDRLIDLGRLFAAETQDTVTFAFNSAAIDATARAALDGQAAWLRENEDVRMTITGHTDLVGGEAYNQRLGLRRAQAVLAYLVRRGVSRSRLDAVASEGEAMPIVETENRERRNRRTVTEVAGFRRNFVGANLDGRYARDVVYEPYRSEAQEATPAALEGG